MPLNTLHDLLISQLKDIYNAEKQVVKALPRMARTASHESLAEAFNAHLIETNRQIARLEEVFEYLRVSPRGPKCRGMEGLVAEGTEMMAEKGEPSVIDAGLIADARRVEHYEIAAYTATMALADTLGQGIIVRLLEKSLEEEAAADHALATLARIEVNPEALAVAVSTESGA